MDIRSTLEPVAGGTLMRWSSPLEPRGLFRLVTPFLGAIGRRQASAIWGNWKRALEAGERPSLEVNPARVAATMLPPSLAVILFRA